METQQFNKLNKELHQLYEKWFENIPFSDGGAFLNQILSDDWVYINYDAELRGKQDYLEYLKDVPPGNKPIIPSDLKIRLVNDLVIVHGTYFAPGVGKHGANLYFTGGWVKRDGGWQCLFHHTTAFPHEV